MNGNGAPTLQTNQNLQNIISSTSGTVKTFNYTRLNDTGNTNDYVFSTTTASLDIAYAIGSGTSLAYHGPNKGSSTLTFTNPCNPSVNDSLALITVCENELADVFGNMVGAGTYNDTIWSSIGCDSIIQVQVVNQDLLTVSNEIDTAICGGELYSVGTINVMLELAGNYAYYDTVGCTLEQHNISVEINEVAIFVHTDNITLEASISGQVENAFWYMCNQDSIIPLSTFLTFTPTIPGEYAFVNQVGECSDTSLCFSITAEDLGIHPIELSFECIVKDKVVTFINPFISNYDVFIYNSLGQIVKSVKNQSTIDMNTFADGVYMIRVNTDNEVLEQKILIY